MCAIFRGCRVTERGATRRTQSSNLLEGNADDTKLEPTASDLVDSVANCKHTAQPGSRATDTVFRRDAKRGSMPLAYRQVTAHRWHGRVVGAQPATPWSRPRVPRGRQALAPAAEQQKLERLHASLRAGPFRTLTRRRR